MREGKERLRIERAEQGYGPEPRFRRHGPHRRGVMSDLRVLLSAWLPCHD